MEVLANYTKPTTKKGLRTFLGAIGFYQRYVELLADQTAVLTPLMAKLAPSKIVWTEEGELAFSHICKCISQCCSLCIPLPEDVFSVVTDASGMSTAGVQRRELGGSHFLQQTAMGSRVAVLCYGPRGVGFCVYH